MKVVTTAVLLAALSPTAHRLEAQQPENTLPPAARQFMESDQLRRWAGMIQAGDSIFNNGSCTLCHGDGGKGTDRAPNLTDSTWVQSDGGFDGIFQTIFWGVRRKDFHDMNRRFEMNPTGGMPLAWNEVRAVTAYVWSLSNGTFLPPRR